MEIIEQLGEQDRADLFHWAEQVFPIEGRALQWCAPSHHLLYRQSGQAIGHIGFGVHTLLSDGEPLDVIGVGQVVVRPEYQGQGIPKAMFEVLHLRAPALLGPKLFTLFCPPRLQTYYCRHGYRTLEGTLASPESAALANSNFYFMYYGRPQPGKRLVLTSHPW